MQARLPVLLLHGRLTALAVAITGQWVVRVARRPGGVGVDGNRRQRAPAVLLAAADLTRTILRFDPHVPVAVAAAVATVVAAVVAVATLVVTVASLIVAVATLVVAVATLVVAVVAVATLVAARLDVENVVKVFLTAAGAAVAMATLVTWWVCGNDMQVLLCTSAVVVAGAVVVTGEVLLRMDDRMMVYACWSAVPVPVLP